METGEVSSGGVGAHCSPASDQRDARASGGEAALTRIGRASGGEAVSFVDSAQRRQAAYRMLDKGRDSADALLSWPGGFYSHDGAVFMHDAFERLMLSGGQQSYGTRLMVAAGGQHDLVWVVLESLLVAFGGLDLNSAKHYADGVLQCVEDSAAADYEPRIVSERRKAGAPPPSPLEREEAKHDELATALRALVRKEVPSYPQAGLEPLAWSSGGSAAAAAPGRGFGGGGGRGGGPGGGRGRGRFPMEQRICRGCNIMGHIQANCPTHPLGAGPTAGGATAAAVGAGAQVAATGAPVFGLPPGLGAATCSPPRR